MIDFPTIDYIIKIYVPDLKKNFKYVKMDLFHEAFIHKSYADKHNINSYDQLEFLGDSVYHFVLTEYLLDRYSEEDDGFITKLRIGLEKGESMAELTKILGINRFIQLYDTKMNNHILEDVFEAFIGAFYLNFGLDVTRILIRSLIERHKDFSKLIECDENYKDILLRYFHQMKWGNPEYDNTRNKTHCISVVRTPDGKLLGKGIDSIKKKAEQKASENCLINLKVIIDGKIDHDWINNIEKPEELEDNDDKKNKNRLPIFNPKNILIKKTDIRNLLTKYDVILPKTTKFKMDTFIEAMTHKSYTKRKGLTEEEKKEGIGCVPLQKKANEKLRWLGDSIIHFILSEHIYNRYKEKGEGPMTILRTKLENKNAIYTISRRSDVYKYVLINRTIETINERNNVSIIGGGFESFIAAIYKELGIEYAREYFLSIIQKEIDIDSVLEKNTNYKDLITSYFNKLQGNKIEYRIIREEGPDHAKKFIVGIYLNNKLAGKGKASSKKSAEQIAARMLYNNLK